MTKTMTDPVQSSRADGQKVAIELTDVCKSFGSGNAVDRVSMRIMDNEFFSILGPSGCGKTTLMRMIAGFEKPTTGSILLHGEPIETKPAHKRDLNMVFQSYALFPHLSVYDNVAFELKVRKHPKKDIGPAVRDALALVHLTGMEDRKPNELSGGQRQRVALARALVSRPALVLLDEPLGALDLKLRKQMQVELKRMQREVGITFVYVTHDQEEALTMSDRIAVMNNGVLLQVEDPQALYDRPATRFVADFIGVSNVLTGPVKSRGGQLVAELEGIGPVPAAIDQAADLAHASIRPELVNISGLDSPDTDDVVTVGEITESIFLGRETEYRIAVTGREMPILAHVANTGGSQHRFPVGQKVKVSWAHDSIRWLRD
ncbi:ABC transporter ATP-binding protein [Streptomyces sp. NPDC091280]|uniref:ABC transporter ATP-binding protein n=1 Tax=Streptomyces sp. NPDC091280 TaxID=3365984 RepID=UPI0038090C06